MTFVSYAQNSEDVMLWRALRHVECGFYIDVGANDPTLYSVTKAFYDRGWRGINVEPVQAFLRKLRAERPDDVNLGVAAAREHGSIRMYDVVGSGLSTTDAAIADRHRLDGYEIVVSEVEARTMAEICNAHAPAEVHFLKVDVEGAERDVLLGADFEAVRPWIVVVEATQPNSQTTTHEGWEHLILSHRYRHAYSDGLNRFYVAEEHADLLGAFAYPPNVFDDAVRAAHRESYLRAQEAEERAAQARHTLTARLQDMAVQAQRISDLERDTAVQIARVRDAEERAFMHASRANAAEAELASTRAYRARAQSDSERLDRELAIVRALSERLGARDALLSSIYASHSWRSTAPARALSARLRGRPTRTVSDAPTKTPPRPTLFIECTHTFHSEMNTGIQRVVRNILRNTAVVGAALGYDSAPVILSQDGFTCVDPALVLADKQREGFVQIAAPEQASAKEASVPPPPVSKRILFGSWRLFLRAARAALPFDAAHRFLDARPDEFGLARLILLPLRVVRRPRERPPLAALAPESKLDEFDSCRGSILLLLDSSWTVPIWPAVARFKAAGGKVVGVIYDLIPITHSHTSVPELTVAFEAWLEEHFKYTDAFVCISASIARQLADFIRSTYNDPSLLERLPIGFFHLGSELDFVRPTDPIRSEIASIFGEDAHSFLMVGSIEPRKQHTSVLDA
ncbi:MAG: FkbM family methyltransferase, partial [Chloroflexota bacterium]|nr:FkbM family methyltransferase [Chloroflexota bacterium]